MIAEKRKHFSLLILIWLHCSPDSADGILSYLAFKTSKTSC